MKSSSAAFSVYNTVKQIFLEFSSHHEKHYKGHIDRQDLRPALSAALGKEITQVEVDQALVSFQDQEGEDTEHDTDERPKHCCEDGDISTTCSSGQQKIRMPEFLVLMQHLETDGVAENTREDGQNQARDNTDIDRSDNMNVSRSDQDPSSVTVLDRATNFLYPHRKILCIQDRGENAKLSPTAPSRHDQDFQSAFQPTQMRYLALVSHNGMKSTMKRFVLANKNIIKKFCLTGTNSTMTMLREVIGNDPEVVYGPSCSSGPLGGDAELAALMTQGRMGGMIFFQDPMSAHPHQADIDSLNRLALVHNTMIVNNPTSAVMMMDVLRSALKGQGRPELIPSFFFSMVSPSVASYQAAQKKMIMQSIADDISSVGGSTAIVSVQEQPAVKRNQAGTRPRTTGTILQRNKIASARPTRSRPLSAAVPKTQKKKSTRQPPIEHIDIVISPSASDTSGNTDVSSRPKGRRVSIKEDVQKPAPSTTRRSSLRQSVTSIMTFKTIDTSAHTAETEGTDLSNEMEDDHGYAGGKNVTGRSAISVRKMNPSVSRRVNTTRNKTAFFDESSRPRWRM